MITVLLAGGTGLIGRSVTRRVIERPDVVLTSLVRTARLPAERQVDFDRLELAQTCPADVAISCLGTTIKSAGSQEAFRQVDHDYVLAFAELARSKGVRQFILISSVGAGGGSFYLRIKGEIEDAVSRLGFARVDLLRPSLLLGPRNERRPGERLAQSLTPFINPVLPTRYRAIEAETVAGAVVRLVGAASEGRHVHHYPEIRTLAA